MNIVFSRIHLNIAAQTQIHDKRICDKNDLDEKIQTQPDLKKKESDARMKSFID